jgi:hypothetical protein
LGSSLDALAQQLNEFLQLHARLEKLKSLTAQLEGESFYEWEEKTDDLEQQLQALSMTDKPGVQALKTLIGQNVETVKTLTQSNLGYARAKSVDGSVGLNLVPPMSTVDPATARAPKRALPRFLSFLYPDADGRLRWFYVFSYLIFMGVLAGAGFNQLYLTKPTFGSWADYIALLGWGFGAEATRSAAVKALQKTDELPELKPDETQSNG